MQIPKVEDSIENPRHRFKWFHWWKIVDALAVADHEVVRLQRKREPGVTECDLLNSEEIETVLGELDARLKTSDVLPFEDTLFQGAILDDVLEHLDDPNPLLTEISRVLVSDGVLVAGAPVKRGYSAESDHKTFYDKKLLVEVMRGAGFSRRRIMHMPLPIPGLGCLLSQYCLSGVFVFGN